MNITYFGHSAFALTTGGQSVLIDPFISGSLHMRGKSIPQELHFANIILTHGHGDHVGDTESLAKAHKAEIIAVPELAGIMAQKGLKATGCALGGKIKFPWGWMRFVQAVHTSSYGDRYAGIAVGVLVNMDGVTVYHAGDTAVFGDMSLIGKMYKPDVMLLPIGGHFTMDMEEALEAVKLVKPRLAIPMHYNTFPVIQADPNEFAQIVASDPDTKDITKVKVMQVLENIGL
ncbi:metal-dependent hydrolase [bacterium]|nr:metal-dependent hydrolase [bacterium]